MWARSHVYAPKNPVVKTVTPGGSCGRLYLLSGHQVNRLGSYLNPGGLK
jgi:hypothetical protein